MAPPELPRGFGLVHAPQRAPLESKSPRGHSAGFSLAVNKRGLSFQKQVLTELCSAMLSQKYFGTFGRRSLLVCAALSTAIAALPPRHPPA